MKPLILDIETSPNMAYVWRAYKTNIGFNQFVEYSNIMCWAVKWNGTRGILHEDARDGNEEQILKTLAAILNEADVVVAHNGKAFDIPVIRSRMAYYGIPPFSPIKIVDTKLEAQKLFGFPMNSLAFLARYLNCEDKGEHGDFPGFSLWSEALKNNKDAWDAMVEYNKQDVDVLEEVYNKLLPWMENHPNVMGANPLAMVCPRCGGGLNRRGYATTNAGLYQRYQCKNCGGWSRSRYTENDFETRKKILTAS